MKRLAKRRRVKTVAQIAIDVVVALIALSAAFLFRHDGVIPPEEWSLLVSLLPVAAVSKTLVNYALGNYRQIWHYVGVREVQLLFLSSIVGSIVFNMLRLGVSLDLSYSIIILDGVLYMLGLFGVRFIRRLQNSLTPGRSLEDEVSPRTLFVGAGDSAHALLRSLKQMNDERWEVVGLLDDDPEKAGLILDGAPVLGPTTELEQVIEQYAVAHVVVAMPQAAREVVHDLIHRAQSNGATVQAVPRMIDILKNGNGRSNGHASPESITIADLADSTEVKKTLLSRVGAADREKKVLVTGGSGYIGSLLVRQLLEEGYSVRLLDNFSFGTGSIAALMDHPDLEIVEGDISSIRDVVSSVKDVGTVVALAAIVGDPACGINAEETLTLNYESTKVLVEACNFYGVSRLVFASSCSVYGASDHRKLTEDSPLNPVSLYARTRILSENVIFERSRDVAPVVLRLSTVFGLSPRMRYDLVINALTVRALVEGKIQIFGGEQLRPFVHCRDAAGAFLAAVKAPVEAVRGETFNVGSDDMNYSIGEIGRIVAKEVGGVDVEYLNHLDDPRNYRVAFSKIRDRLGFRPSIGVEDGIREMIEAIETTPALRDYNDPVYSNVKVLQDLLDSTHQLAFRD